MLTNYSVDKNVSTNCEEYYDDEHYYDDDYNMLNPDPDFDNIEYDITGFYTDREEPYREPYPDFRICLEEKGKKVVLNQDVLIRAYVKYRNIVTFGKSCYSPLGLIPDGEIEQDLYDILTQIGYNYKLSSTITEIVKALKMYSYVEDLEVDENVIPLQNGDLEFKLNCDFVLHRNLKRHMRYRLPVAINMDYLRAGEIFDDRAPLPTKFGKWLNETFYKEDIETVQMMLGYCLIPTTKLQEMYIIEGEAGVGKSGIKFILEKVLGPAFGTTSLALLATDKYRSAQIENKLVLLDEELSAEGLKDVDFFKKVVSNEGKIAVEKKNVNVYEINSFCKLLCCTNEDLITNEKNNNEGFFRRLHPICIKPRDPNRKNIEGFYQQMWNEGRDFILLWMLHGLHKLRFVGWKIPWSDRSREYLNKMRKDALNVPDFLEDRCDFGEDFSAATKELYRAYFVWCKDNLVNPISERGFARWMSGRATQYGLTPEKHLKMPDGTEARGYYGLKLRAVRAEKGH